MGPVANALVDVLGAIFFFPVFTSTPRLGKLVFFVLLAGLDILRERLLKEGNGLGKNNKPLPNKSHFYIGPCFLGHVSI